MSLNPFKEKFRSFYMTIAVASSHQSYATKLKVGAVIVTKTGLIGTGWNGMPPGFENECEYELEDRMKTKDEVIHAERNALDKLGRQGVSAEGAILFVTTAPCIECAKSLHAQGIREVYYLNKYKNAKGIQFLKRADVAVCKLKEVFNEEAGIVEYIAATREVKPRPFHPGFGELHIAEPGIDVTNKYKDEEGK